MARKQLTRDQIMDYLGVSDRTLYRLIDEGLPSVGKGESATFPWPECRKWKDKQIATEAAEKAVGKPADLDEARARREAALAEQEELKLGQLRKELMTVADYDRAVGGTLGRVDGRLKSLPQRIAATQWPAEYAERLEVARGLVEEVRGELRPEAAA